MRHSLRPPHRRGHAAFAALGLLLLAGWAAPTDAKQKTVSLVSRPHPSLLSDTPFESATEAVISADGRFVAFVSASPQMVDGFVDGNGGNTDVFLRDLQLGTTVLVSHGPASAVTGSSSISSTPSISADGRYVAFVSYAGDLVAGQVDPSWDADAFVFDRLSGEVRLVSHAAGTPLVAVGCEVYFQADPPGPQVSADGSRVAFVSRGTNLVAGQVDPTTSADVFVLDVAGGGIQLASHAAGQPLAAGNAYSQLDDLSADGSRVAFSSLATDLVAGLADTNAATDVFVADVSTGAVSVASGANGGAAATANGASRAARLSADGTKIVFLSLGTNLVPAQSDSNSAEDVFLRDLGTSTTRLVSHAFGAPTVAADGNSSHADVSANGSAVAFMSQTSNLVSPPCWATANAFVFDAASGLNTLVSRDANGQAVGAASARISADGQDVAFETRGNPLPGDLNGEADVYLFHRLGGSFELVSSRATTPGTPGNDFSTLLGLAASGGDVVYRTYATDVVAGAADWNRSSDLVAWSPGAGARLVTRVAPLSRSSTALSGAWGDQCSVGADGRRVLFHADDPVFVPGASSWGAIQAYLFDRVRGFTQLASRRVAGPTVGAGAGSARLSADGRFVGFTSVASDVVAGQVDMNFGNDDVFLLDRAAGTLSLVSHAAGSAVVTADHTSWLVDLSSDGRYVLIESLASDLLAGATVTSNQRQLYLCDRLGSSCQLVTHAAGAPTVAANDGYYYDTAVLSADGRYVAYASWATDLVAGQSDLNGALDVFLFDRQSGLNVLASRQAGSATATANGVSGQPRVASDGSFVAFGSTGTNLVPGQSDANGGGDVFLFERASGAVTLVSHASTGSSTAANAVSANPFLSGSGRYVAFDSSAQNLVPGQVDPPGSSDAFVYDRVAGTSRLLSHAYGTPLAAVGGWVRTISASGNAVAFVSSAANLVAGQVPGTPSANAFWAGNPADSVELASPRVGQVNQGAGGVDGAICLSADGAALVFASESEQLVADDRNATRDVFVYGATHTKGDLNDDAATDLILRSLSTPVHNVWELDGDANRLASVDVSPDQTSADWQLVGVDDFDGDLQSDLLFRNMSTAALEVWMMNGTTRTGAPVPVAAAGMGLEWKLSATADFDQNGWPDLVWRNTVTRDIYVFAMNGTNQTGFLLPTPGQAVDGNWEIVAAGDLDLDGNTDLVWYNWSSGRIVFWLLDAQLRRITGRFANPMQAGNANWKVMAAGDFGVGAGGDPGTFDLVWRNSSSGRLVLWNLDTGGNRTAGRFFNPDAPANPLNWTVAGPR